MGEKGHIEITEEDRKYEISWEFGFNDYRRYFEITKENAERAMKSDEDSRALMFYAQTGHWSSTKIQEEILRDVLSEFLDLLIRIPANQNYFTGEENRYLDELLEKYGLK